MKTNMLQRWQPKLLKCPMKIMHRSKVCTHLLLNQSTQQEIDTYLSIYICSVSVDPCAKIHCGAGRVCQAVGESASCVCIPDCPEQSDPRRKVCTNRNETWNSDCHVHRERCLCDTDDDRCKSAELKHIQINYYGDCREMPVNKLQKFYHFIYFFIFC